MSLSWFTLGSSSVWYALAARAAPSRSTSPFLSVEAAACVDRALAAAGLNAPGLSPRFWRRFAAEAAVAQGSGGASTDDVATFDESTLAACWRRAAESSGANLEGWSIDESAFAPLLQLPLRLAEVLPQHSEQLRLRVRPFLELWEARGPGLLRRLESELNRRLPPVSVHWVQPFHGGGGWADPDLHVVFMEALLVNPFAPIPEPLRLAWLIAQCAGSASPESLVPAVLAAGEYVEWTVCDAAHIALARQAWFGKEEVDHVS